MKFYHPGLLDKETGSIMIQKMRRVILFTMLAVFLSSVVFTSSLLPILPTLVEDAAAQTHPDGCDKCILIEYEGVHTAVIGGVDSFTNMTTHEEQYNSYLWQFVNKLISQGFKIDTVITDSVGCEDDEKTEHMYHVILDVP
jgi:hypothetical protein